jgi:ABC-type nickel/cobalt efflux system permease component RcnA
MPRGKLLAISAIALFCGLPPAARAIAHPLGNFSINRYARLELGRQQARIHYVIDRAEIPALQEAKRIDTNGDGNLSDSERAAYLDAQARELAAGVVLRADGQPLNLTIASRTFEALPGQGGLQTHRIELTLQAPPIPARAQIALTDANFADRVGWREFVVRAAEGVVIEGEAVPTAELSDALKRYPEDPAFVKPRHESLVVRVDASAATGTADLPTAANATAPRIADPLSGLLPRGQLTLSTALFALVAAIGWGASHALSPGHGKTVAAAYLIGARATARHALLLGATTTVTHTASVYVLGLLTLLASQWLVPERLFPWIEAGSGIAILLLGATLLRGRLRALTSRPRSDHNGIDPLLPHDHGDGFTHRHAAPADGWRNVLIVGATGGLLPCPSAMVLMLGAVALGHVAFGLALVLAFSAGLAAVLVTIGMALVRGRELASHVRWPQGNGVRVVARLAPLLSATVITIAGAVMTARAFVT